MPEAGDRMAIMVRRTAFDVKKDEGDHSAVSAALFD